MHNPFPLPSPLVSVAVPSQDSARFCLFCESVLTPCVSQPDPSLNPAAHLAGVAPASGKAGVEGGNATDSPAFRLRLRRLLAACLGYVEEELSKVR